MITIKSSFQSGSVPKGLVSVPFFGKFRATMMTSFFSVSGSLSSGVVRAACAFVFGLSVDEKRRSRSAQKGNARALGGTV